MNETRFGPRITDDGVTFTLWAPAAKSVEVVLDRPLAMTRARDGWFSLTVPEARAGSLYKFRIDGHLDVPDPASQFQPRDVSGPSEVLDHDRFRWRADNWRGRLWEEAVFMETHVGTFTPEGNYRGMIGKLDHLVATGVTALELMPLADFPGRWNWGYDGVLWYAPDHVYGCPEDLKTLIDEAHLRGLMVFLDVVYNHFGPDGNYLGNYAPSFFSDTQTPWGNAIDYRVPEVRQFAIENALHWLKDYRFDGLRLDAVHAITENGERHMLHDLSEAVGGYAASTGRHIHLVLENDDNRAALLDPAEDPPQGRYRAQWNDDYHHAWHVILTGENAGYYEDYPEPQENIARIFRSGFAYQGEASLHRNGAPRGEFSAHLPPPTFVNFLQNHDQIGNRALGDRLNASASAEAVEAALAVTLLAPTIPLLFMGEEWGATSPFPFFCDFQGDLADAVRQGRRREFRAAYKKIGDQIPDPFDEETVKSARLNWNSLNRSPFRDRLTLVRKLLSIRHSEITPHLAGSKFDDACISERRLLLAAWRLGNGMQLQLAANLSDAALEIADWQPRGRSIWGAENVESSSPWSVHWVMGER
jgi:maltooligosyltrehalose trehalohydrolase